MRYNYGKFLGFGFFCFVLLLLHLQGGIAWHICITHIPRESSRGVAFYTHHFLFGSFGGPPKLTMAFSAGVFLIFSNSWCASDKRARFHVDGDRTAGSRGVEM